MSDPYLEFNPIEHRYYVDGAEYPSVTQVLDRAGLISEFCKDEEARERGLTVHQVTADYDRHTADITPTLPEPSWYRYAIA